MRFIGVIAGIVIALLVIHFCSLEGLEGLLLSALAEEEDTIFAPGYSGASFRAVQRGMSEAEVLGRLHGPLGEVWIYERDRSNTAIGFSGNLVNHVSRENSSSALDVALGMSKDDVVRRLGSPTEKTFIYSRSRGDKSYHVRVVAFRGGRVTQRISEFYLD